MKNKQEKRGRKEGSTKLTPTGKMKKYSKDGSLDEYNFQYIIPPINQWVILKNGWDLDIIDMAVYNQIKGFIDSGEAEKITDSKGNWYFVSELKIAKDLPCVPINSKSGIYRIIKKLVDCNLLERNPTNRLTGKKYLRYTSEGVKKLTYTKPNQND